MTALATPTYNVLIFGGANTGKSAYVFQLYGRLNAGSSRLKLRYQPEDLSLIVVGYDRLSAGLPPEHTTSGASADVTLPLLDPGGNPYDVPYPDYAGEQVDNMVNKRQVTAEWKVRVESAPSWLLFLRLDHFHDPKDVVTTPLEPRSAPPSAEGEAPWGSGRGELGDQARTVEALQLLLHVGGTGTAERVRRPTLAVVLSCWDELAIDEGTTPQAVLRERLPLVDAFVRANWHPDATVTYGLSAQGKPLVHGVPDDEFIDRGPEAMGYVVGPDGKHDPDLTLPLFDTLSRTDWVA